MRPIETVTATIWMTVMAFETVPTVVRAAQLDLYQVNIRIEQGRGIETYTEQHPINLSYPV